MTTRAKEYVTIREATEITGLHRDTIRRALNRGNLKRCQPRDTRTIRIREADLHAWMESGMTNSPVRRSPTRRKGRFAEIVDQREER